MKLGTQQQPFPTIDNDVATKNWVERLGGRGAPEFIHAKVGTQHTNPSVSDPVHFDTVLGSRGLSMSAGARFSGLKAGRTYLVSATLYVGDAGGGHLNFEWYDVTNAAGIGTWGTAQCTTEGSNDSSQPNAIALFSPEQDVEIECRVTGGVTGAMDVQADASSAYIIEISGPAIAGPMEFIETIEVEGSAVQDIDFEGLNGNDDERYVIEVEYINGTPGTGNRLTIQPNSLATNQSFDYGSIVGGVDSYATGTVMEFENSNDDSGDFTINLAARTGKERLYHFTGAKFDADGGAGNALWGAGAWSDTSTNITSLRFHASLAAGWGVGTRISLYRLRAQNFPENSFPPNHLDGLKTIYNSVSTVDIGPGTCKDSTNTVDITVSSTLTANLAGTPGDPNSLDTGTEAANSGYALHVIYGIGKAVASLISLSETAPTLPTGYTHFRCVGWIYNKSSNIVKFTQFGNGQTRQYFWTTSAAGGAILTNGQATTLTAVDCSAQLPASATAISFGFQYVNNSTAARYFQLAAESGGETFAYRVPFGVSATPHYGSTHMLPMDASQQVWYLVSTTGSSSHELDLYVHGFTYEL